MTEAPSHNPNGNIARSRSRYRKSRPKDIVDIEGRTPCPPTTVVHHNRTPTSPTDTIQAKSALYQPRAKIGSAEWRNEAGTANLVRASQQAPEQCGSSGRDRTSTDHIGSENSHGPCKGRYSPPSNQVPSTTVATRASPRSKQSSIAWISGHKAHGQADSAEDLTTAQATIPSPDIGLKPAFDAPVSAFNAGERRVAVKYGQSVMPLAVTPFTTPVDIVRSAADHMPEKIDPKTTVLLESFRQLGLERPLRRYEHVRDVMNSWDNDTSNNLIIIPSPPDGRDGDLELSHVSRSQPGDISVQIYHSQRPGHWDKRWINLRSDGQVLIARKVGAEASNICHLSDFDIYIPTARQISKKIKPPRKFCFAIKSQQKSSMFESTVNFVHFFSTNDKAVATAWYKAVQEWRSWYLVNVMGEGSDSFISPSNERSSWTHGAAHGAAKATNPDNRDLRGRISASTARTGSLSSHKSRRSRDAPPISFPVSFPKKLTKDANTGAPTTRRKGPSIVHKPPPAQVDADQFVATGLLGRSYTLRQKSQHERESSPNRIIDEPPPIPLHKPLIDLTPQFKEPPQFAKRERGVRPKQVPPGGLIGAATSPEKAIHLPRSATWRRRGSSGGSADPDLHRSRTTRRNASGGPATESRYASASPGKGTAAFTGGLLAGESRSQGGIGTGRGIMTGDREAKAPMLDMDAESKYAPGSLLARVESNEGGLGPIIDREKRREVNAAVGENL